MNTYKIVVVGLGYVGLSNAVLLAQHNEVIAVDTDRSRVNAINAGRSPIKDDLLSGYLKNTKLKLCASTDLRASVIGADFVVVSTPTNYDEDTNFFDSSFVEEVTEELLKLESGACIVVKSTMPVGFTEKLRKRLNTESAIFSQEFLRKGCALYDNLHPSRMVIVEHSKRAKTFAGLLSQ